MKVPIWEPSEERKKNTNITRYMAFVNERYRQSFESYDELYDWSINKRQDFWASVWEFYKVKASKPYHTVMTKPDQMIGCKWFEGARLNFAEHMLRYRDNRTALIFKGENQQAVRMTYAEFYDQVARLAKALRETGVTIGDRVVGYMPNMIESAIAMVATSSIGAVWSCCSPEFGISATVDRFAQIEPKVLFTANGYSYKGSLYDSLQRVIGIVKDIPSIRRVVVVPYTIEKPDISQVPNSISYDEFLSTETSLEIQFEQLTFDHPLTILYTSGTTGTPKCIVHSAGGSLIQLLLDLGLEFDFKPEDTFFQYTTTGWIMWNSLLASLLHGATSLLYDGNPFYPDPGALFKLAQDEKVTIFGTSARYLAAVERAGVKPVKEYNLSRLRSILSTGSPLSVESHEFVYRDIKKDVHLISHSGGTDSMCNFVGGNPIGPLYAGEIQCRILGMKVEAFDSQGNSVVNQKGELVITAPFPSEPLYFWNDENNQKYHSTYFSRYPNAWWHGDYIEITENGGAIIYGRSDTTLNPGGVRIGTAEIYRPLECLSEIEDSVVVGQEWHGDIRVILFVKLAEGRALSEELIEKITTIIRDNTTPRHIPAKIIAVDDIPYNFNGKRVELVVWNVVNNKPVPNVDSLVNPSSLDLYRNIKELQS